MGEIKLLIRLLILLFISNITLKKKKKNGSMPAEVVIKKSGHRSFCVQASVIYEHFEGLHHTWLCHHLIYLVAEKPGLDIH